MKISKKHYQIVFGLLLFSLPMEGAFRIVPNLILIVLLLTYPFVSVEKKKRYSGLAVFLPLFSLMAFVVISSIISQNLNDNISIIGKLVLISLVVLCGNPIRSYFEQLKLYLIIGTAVSILISFFSILIYIYQNGAFSFANGPEINKVLLTERPYMAFLCVLCFIFSLEKVTTKKESLKWIFVANMMLLTLFLFFVSARMGIVTIGVIGLVYCVKRMKKAYILLPLLLVGMASAIITNKNLINRIQVDKTKSIIENIKIWEPRAVIWPCSFKIFATDIPNRLVGFQSLYESREKLVLCYGEVIDNKKKREWFVQQKFNTHSQFLSILLAFGYIGFFLFISTIFAPIILKKGNMMVFFLILSILLFGLVENYFERQLGSYLFSLFLYFSNPE